LESQAASRLLASFLFRLLLTSLFQKKSLLSLALAPAALRYNGAEWVIRRGVLQYAPTRGSMLP